MKYLKLMPLLLLTSCYINDPKCKADQVVIGMSEEDLINTCGITKRNYNSYGSAQWVYRGREELFVYTENGKVRSKQWSH